MIIFLLPSQAFGLEMNSIPNLIALTPQCAKIGKLEQNLLNCVGAVGAAPEGDGEGAPAVLAWNGTRPGYLWDFGIPEYQIWVWRHPNYVPQA